MCKYLFVFFIFLASSCFANLPELGNSTRSIMPLKNEKLIGDAWLRQLRLSGKVSYDPLITNYIREIGKKLELHAGIKSFPVNFFPVQDESFNAFAFFGGNIGVHEGLILHTNNESELAAVIAHELAHISQEHMLRQIAIHRQLLPITMAEAIAAIALGVPDLIMPILAGHSQQNINFSREHEKEADRIGITILARAGFDPQSMPNLFLHMQKKSRYSSAPPEYLLTHPLYENRIADARHRAENFSYMQSPSKINYYLIKARVYALSLQNAHDKIEHLQYQINNNRSEHVVASKYALAIVLANSNELKKALDILQSINAEHKNNLIIQQELIEVEWLNGMQKKSIKKLQQLYKEHPNNLSIALLYAEKLILSKQADKAKKVLTSISSKFSQEPMIYYHLGKAESSLNNLSGMYEANAKWEFLHANYSGALIQLKLALDETINEYDQKRIKQLRQEIENIITLEKKL